MLSQLMVAAVSMVVLVLIIQDFKSRLVSLWLIICLFLLNVTLLIMGSGFLKFGLFILTSGTLVLFLISLLYLYTYLRFRGQVKFFAEAFAWGDVFFLISICSVFQPIGLALYIVFSCLLAILVTLITGKFDKDAHKSIPFVSYMGIAYLISLTFLFLETGKNTYLSDVLFNLDEFNF